MNNNYNYGFPPGFEPRKTENNGENNGENKAWDRVLEALEDNLFLILCILLTASCAIEVMNRSLPVLQVLFAVFLWIIYSKATQGEVDVSNLRHISGTVYAEYILINVVCICIAVVGMLLGFIMFAMKEYYIRILEATKEVEFMDPDAIELIDMLSGTVGAIVAVLVVCIAAVGIVVNYFSYRSFHKLAQSVYKGVENGRISTEYANRASTWMWVFGVIILIGSLGDLFDFAIIPFLSSAIEGSIFIVSALLVQRYISD